MDGDLEDIVTASGRAFSSRKTEDRIYAHNPGNPAHCPPTIFHKKGMAKPSPAGRRALGEALGIGRMGLYLSHDNRPVTEAEIGKNAAPG